MSSARLVKDIFPGPTSSAPAKLIAVGDDLYFSALDERLGRELHKLDTRSGLVTIVKNIGAESYFSPNQGAEIGSIVAHKGTLYFVASTPETGPELWRSDGTEKGTKLVADLQNGRYGSYPTSMTIAGDSLYFTATSSAGQSTKKLWKLDLTKQAPPVLVSDLVSQPEPVARDPHSEQPNSPTRFLSLGNRIYFQGTDGDRGTELWVTDGTEKGTICLTDGINSSSYLSSSPSEAILFKGDIYFNASNIRETGSELWKLDPRTDTISLVKDIRPAGSFFDGSNPRELTVIGDAFYFRADDGVHGYQVWRSDGTEQGTTMLTSIGTSPSGILYPAAPLNLMAAGDTLFFQAATGFGTTGLWTTDGTAEGTERLNTASGSSELPLPLDNVPPFTIDDQFFWFASSGVGVQLWSSDGNVASEVKGIPTSISPSKLVPLGDQLYFSAFDASHGNELWAMDLPTSQPIAYSSRVGRNQIHESGGDPSRWLSAITFRDPTASLETVYWETESISKTTFDGRTVDAVTRDDFKPASRFERPSSITIGSTPNPPPPLRGSASLNAEGVASFELRVLADQRTEGDEQFKIVFYKDDRRTQELHRSELITIKDSSRSALFYQSSSSAGAGFFGDPILVEGRDIDNNLKTVDNLRITFSTNDKTLSEVYWKTQSPQKLAVGNNRFDSVNKADFIGADGRPLSGLLPLSGSQQIRNGQAQINLKAAADHVLEDDERFRLIFYKDASLSKELHQTPLFSIRDTSNKPLVSIERVGAATVREGEDLVYRFTRLGSTNNPLEVQIGFDGDARADRDYLKALDTVVFPEGASSTELRMQTYDDVLDEGPAESVRVSLLPGSGYEIDGSKAVASVNLADSTVLTSNLPQVIEGGQLRFTLTRSNPAGNYSNPLFIVAVLEDGLGKGAALEGATAQRDYVRNGALCFVFPKGKREVSVDVQTLDDRLAESTYEDLRLHVLAPVSGLTAYTFTGIIADNDRDAVTGNPLPGARVLAKQISSNPSYGDSTRVSANLAAQQLTAGLRRSPGFVSDLQAALLKNGRLVGNDSASLVGNDSASIIPGGTASFSNATSITNQLIASLVANGGGNLIANGGGNLIANGGGN